MTEPCEQSAMVDLALARGLDADQEKALKKHLKTCSICDTKLQQGLDLLTQQAIETAQERADHFVPEPATWRQWTLLGSIVLILVLLSVWLAGDMFRYRLLGDSVLQQKSADEKRPISLLPDGSLIAQWAVGAKPSLESAGVGNPDFVASGSLKGLAFQAGLLSVDQDAALARFDNVNLNLANNRLLDVTRRSGAGDVVRTFSEDGRIETKYLGDFGGLLKRYEERGLSEPFLLGRWLAGVRLFVDSHFEGPSRPELPMPSWSVESLPDPGMETTLKQIEDIWDAPILDLVPLEELLGQLPE